MLTPVASPFSTSFDSRAHHAQPRRAGDGPVARALMLMLVLGGSACEDTALTRPAGLDPRATTTPAEPIDETTPPGLAPSVPPVVVARPSDDLPTGELAYCLPEALDYGETEIPELPLDVLGGLCAANDVVVSGSDGATASISYLYEPARQTLTVDSVDSGGWWSSTTVFTLDADWNVREIAMEGQGGFYAVEVGSTVFRFDEDGHLVYKLARSSWEPGGELFAAVEKTQTWERGTLVERVERDTLTNALTRRWSWEYDGAGRLIGARFERPTDGFEQSVEWSYQEGLPSALRRVVNGAEVELQSWEWSDGVLLSRDHHFVGPSVAAVRRGEDPEGAGQYAYLAGLDSMEGVTMDWMSTDPWAGASTLAVHEGAAGACRNLPRGAGHGYPLDEGLHDLGVAPGERPNGIGFAYGYVGYGWMYGDDAWYGHAGVSTFWPGYEGGWWQELSGHIDYDDAGRMAAEQAVIWRGDGTQELAVDRLRSYGERDITDVAAFTMEGQTKQRTLRYHLDDASRLTRRELLDGEVVMEAQTWTHDTGGRLLAHDLSSNWSLDDTPPFGWLDQWHSGLGTDMTHIFWSYDDAGRLIARGTDQGNAERISYDAAGRVASRQGSFAHYSNDSLVEYTYDGAGRLARECTLTPSYPTVCTVTEYDPAGRLTQVVQESGDEVFVLQARGYACAE